MPKIVGIIESDSFNMIGEYGETEVEGYIITLDDGSEIKIGISNLGDCCELWGYMSSDDDLSYYIGAEYLKLRVTDTQRATYEEIECGVDGGDIMFVDIFTDRGPFQLVMYNCHNGYYGHEAIINIGNQLHHHTVL